MDPQKNAKEPPLSRFSHMQLTLPQQLSQFANVLQQQLFPLLTPAVGPISDRAALFIAVCAMVPLRSLLPQGRWPGRPSKDLLAIARAFLAKKASTAWLTPASSSKPSKPTMVCASCAAGITPASSLTNPPSPAPSPNSPTPNSLPPPMKPSSARPIPTAWLATSPATVPPSKPASVSLIPSPKTTPKAKGKKKRKKAVFAKESAACRAKRETRIQKQAKLKTVKEMLEGVPTACDIGGKKGNNGCVFWWRGYKFHLDVADGQIPISALLTAASVHDSQVAIALMEMSSKRVTYLYEIMDSAYDASAIYQASADRNHQPIINPHPRRKSKTQLPLLVKPQPQLCPANAERYKIRTMVERVFGRLKDEFGADKIRVRGNKKVMAHLMFSVLALTVDQLLRLNT